MSGTISIYWWNCGKKKLEYEGDCEGYLKLRGITKREIRHPTQKDIKGLRFKIPLSSTAVTLDTYDTSVQAYDDAIRVFLLLLGDKTMFSTGRGREYKINWR